MILITSGTYVHEELRSEFGDVPPAFLPLANRPVYVHQLEVLKECLPNENVFLSLPESFEADPEDLTRLNRKNITTVRVPDGLSLCNSVLFALNTIGRYDETTRILHGDTILEPLPKEADVILVGQSADDYAWDKSSSGIGVWAGYFAFSDTKNLVRSLAFHDNFADAVRAYSHRLPLREVEAHAWQDLGHLNTYYEARRVNTTERSFNTLNIRNGIVEKSGTPPEKICSEARWFSLLPRGVKPMTPAFYGTEATSDSAKYWIEYLPLAPLNELMVHGRNSVQFWQRIIELYSGWFHEAVAYSNSPSVERANTNAERANTNRHQLIVTKTRERLSRFSADNDCDLDRPMVVNGSTLPSVRELSEEMIEESRSLPGVPGLQHGDICFSNTLYDSRNRRLRFLDPRGVSPDAHDLIGDVRYDIAKLTHSFVGYYDLIIAGMHEIEKNGDYDFHFRIPVTHMQKKMSQAYLNSEFEALPKGVIEESISDTILLFLSMLPLHSDKPNRQLAFLLNAYRLYVENFRKEI